jgi:hypothetical protein
VATHPKPTAGNSHRHRYGRPVGGLVVIMSFKFCTACERNRLTDGGVQISASRWFCQSCWVNFFNKKTRA